MSDETERIPVLDHVEPVLSVTHLIETLDYWQQVLGFENRWTWGDPPVHGAISWQNVHVQFAQKPELAGRSRGNALWIRVHDASILYQLHQKTKADIVAPLVNEEWGMAQYTVKDLNGYYIHFASQLGERQKSAARMPGTVRIVSRKPSVSEYRTLLKSVGWGSSNPDDAAFEKVLSLAVCAAVAEDATTNEAIGCALLMGDNISFYYVKDVMVRPEWQGKRVGSGLMVAIKNWLDQYGARGALVSLITGDKLESFYQQSGFVKMFGMGRYLPK